MYRFVTDCKTNIKMTQNTNIKKQCAYKLKTMAPNVSAKDKKDAAKELGVHYNTVSNYLDGKVADIEKGIELVGFLKGRIEDRIRGLKKAFAA